MRKWKDKKVDLLRVNVDTFSKCDFRCEDCYRFFECQLPHKQEFYRSNRIDAITENLSRVKHIIAVMSGKGGVGKSIISANLAVGLAGKGYSVGVVDSDLYGPSIPSILGMNEGQLMTGKKGMVPPEEASRNVKVVSMDFLLGDEDPLTWLSDLKRSAQVLFLANVNYGSLDYLIIDMPPGTGSETVNLLKYLPQLSGVIMVTMSSDITETVVRRCISLCQQVEVPIMGLIENMSQLVCPHCGKTYGIEHGPSNILSSQLGIPLLGSIERDPLIVEAADKGRPFILEYPDSEASKNFERIVGRVEQAAGSEKKGAVIEEAKESDEGGKFKILEINYDPSCQGKSCYSCADYFNCTLPKKSNLQEYSIFKKIKDSMSGVKYKIAVMSCKGGVGKSTLAANLAVAMAQKGKKIVILDCDFHGPCIPKMLGVESKGMKYGKEGIIPLASAPNVKVVSMDFLVEPDEAVTWFDPLKKMTVAQFLYGVNYGNPDYLIIDLPPGTGAESYGLLQCIPDLDGAVIITLPSESPQVVARRSIGLCRQAGVPILGLVENMSYFVCASCQNISKLSGTKETASLAKKTGISFLGSIPLDANIFETCDEGVPFVTRFPDSAATQSVLGIADRIQRQL